MCLLYITCCICVCFFVLACSRPVFVCIGMTEGDQSWEKSFSQWPWGVCEQLMPLTSRLHPVAWVQRTQNLYNWSEPYNRYTMYSISHDTSAGYSHFTSSKFLSKFYVPACAILLGYISDSIRCIFLK